MGHGRGQSQTGSMMRPNDESSGPHRVILEPMRSGTTLLEMLIVLSLLSLLVLIAFPTFGPLRDRSRVEDVALEITRLHWQARQLAQRARWTVAFDLSGSVFRLRRIDGSRDSLVLERPGPDERGVMLYTSRSTIAFGPTGVGWGAANTTVVLSRGSAEATLVTSRLGRLRRVR